MFDLIIRFEDTGKIDTENGLITKEMAQRLLDLSKDYYVLTDTATSDMTIIKLYLTAQPRK